MTSNDLKRGQVILLDTAPCLVLDVSSQSPSARGGSTLIKTKYRNLLTGQVLEKTFKAGERVDAANFEKRKGQFLYADGDHGIFMDLESYEQYELGDEMYGPVKGFLLDGTDYTVVPTLLDRPHEAGFLPLPRYCCMCRCHSVPPTRVARCCCCPRPFSPPTACRSPS